MGYCIQIRKSAFRIERAQVENAFQAAVALGTGENGDPRARGGGWSGGQKHTTWFSWMNGEDVAEWRNLSDAMEAWRFPIKLDAEGNVVGISFSGEKIGEENLLFAAIAPFVTAGSFIRFHGEDDHEWEMQWDGTAVHQKGLGYVHDDEDEDEDTDETDG